MKRLHWLIVSILLVLHAPFASDAVAQSRTAIDRGAEDRCADGTRVGSRSCSAEEYLLEVLRTNGVGHAMASLERLVARDDDARRDAHSYAHAIGIAAYTGSEPVGEVFARCTPAHQSGCYHGVIQSYFLQQIEDGERLDGALVNALCRDHREDPEARWLLFQCAHGMGHGLVMLADRHLPTSLESCDLVEDSWEREACYGGVFMENVVGATAPHHSIGRPQADDHDHGAATAASPSGGAHDHHDADHSTAAAPREDFPPLKAEEPFYPCNVLDDRYLPACYQMQTSAILHFNGQDIAAAAETCTAAPDLFRSVCFQSLGRDISARTGQDNARAIQFCSLAPESHEPACHIGYAKNLIDLTADPNDGLDYCRLLPEGHSKRICYVAVGEQVWVLHDSADQRTARCSAAEPDYVEHCRSGAGLPPESVSPPGSAEPDRSDA